MCLVLQFVLASLATWRLTHLLTNEDGPADLLYRLRVKLGSGLVGQLMDCFYCLSFCVAAPFALLLARRPLEWFFVWIASSGAACLLQHVIESRFFAQTREAEARDGMLQPENNRRNRALTPV